ncbi:serine-rich adhesin for platelets-like [Dreissena polymorpha]|uniref:serine-rich adhesin for platelets-like n=1 Tax=Dreissena polymorpha TaxID=45954 RepID=UPI0022656576|nr:serine-rich adhesin for platelets-like [Dreissena polymorpha]
MAAFIDPKFATAVSFYNLTPGNQIPYDVSDQVLLSYNRPPVFTPSIMEFIKALLRKDKADNAYRFPERNCLSPVITTSTTTTITTTTTPTPVNTPSLWEMLLKILQSELDTRTSTTTTIAPTTTTTIPTTTEMPIWKLLLEKLQGILPTTATSITVTGGTIAQVSPTQTLSATTPSLGYDQSTAFIYLETTNTSEFDNLTFENKTEASATFDNITEFSLNGHHTPISFEAMSVTPANGVPDLLSTVSQLTNNSDAYTKVLADMIKAIEKELASRKGEQEDKANKSSSEQVTTDNFLSITQTMTENKRHINYEMSTPSTLFEGTTSVVDNIYSTLETPVNTHRQMQEQEVTNVVNSYSGATQVPNPIARSATVPIPFDKMFGLFPNTGQDRSNLPTTKAYDWSITTPINTTPPPPASTQLPNMIVQLMERIGYTPMAPTAQSDVIGSEQSEIESLLQIMNSDPQSRRRQAVYGLLSSKESNQNGNRDVNLNSFKSKSSGYTTITTNPIVFGKGSKEIVNNRTPSSTVTSDRNDTIKSVLRDFHPQPEEMTSAIYLTEDVTSAILVTEGVTSATELTAEIQSTIKNESTKTLESMPSAISNQSVWQQNNKESSTEIHLGFVTSSIGKAKQRVQSISTSRPEEATKAVTMETTYDMKAQGRAIATTPSSLSGTNVNQRSSEKPSTRLRNNQVNYKRYS